MITDILRLNIWDLNHVNSSIQPAVYNSTSAFSINNGLTKRIKSFGGHFVMGLLDLIRSPRPQPNRGGALLYVTTRNQLNSLSPLLDQLSDCLLWSDRNQVKTGYRYPAFWAHLVSIFFWPLILVHFWRARKERNLLFLCRNGLDRYLLTYGYYVVSRVWLKRHRPGVVVVSNDSAVFQRSLCMAARHEGIPTVFIQHASVSPLFPALMFDYALLDGTDALEAYERPDHPSSTKVFLVGMPKFDRYFSQINRNDRVESMGICVNMLDQEGAVRALVDQLRSAFPQMAIHLRPHPRENRMAMWQDLADTFDLSISDATTEDSFALLAKVDVVLAGHSSIHVEAVMLNVYSIFYDFQPNSTYTAYSFVEKGLSRAADTPDAVCDAIRQLKTAKPRIRDKANPYCATIGTRYDGLSSKLAANIINTIASGREVSLSEWRRNLNFSQEAYELRA